MTTRRPPRISGDIPLHGPRDEEHLRRLVHDLNQDVFQGEPAGTLPEVLNPQVLRSMRDLPDETAAPVLHPALTNYGPDSAADFFRQARLDHEPVLQSPHAPLRIGRRSRTQKALRSEPGNFSNGLSSPDGHGIALWEGPDLLELSDAEGQPLSGARVVSTDARRRWRRSNEVRLGRNEHQVSSLRKGAKRARRTSTWNAINNGEDSLSIWDAPDVRKLPPSTSTSPRLSQSDRPASAEMGESSTHDWFRDTREAIEIERDDNSGDVTCPTHNMDAEVPPAHDRRRPLQIARPQRSRNLVGCRRSRLLSPPHTMQEPSRRLSRDSIARALPQPDDYVYEGSDGDSHSSREDFTIDRALTDMHPNMPQLGAHASSRRVDSHHSEDTPLSFLEHAPAQTLIEEQCLTSWQLPPSTMSDGDIFAHQQTLSTYEQMPAVNMRGCSVQRKRTGLDQPDSPKILRKPPVCQPKGTSCGWPVIPTEIYLEIARYLSREDALNLRLVCRDFSIAMMGAIFGSVVVPFGRAMYDTGLTNTDHTPSGSIFEKYGLAIRKFGICFEADADLIAKAQPKTISDEQSSWWGSYSWPTPVYPRFSHLHNIENLADNVSLLKSAMAHLGKTHELGLSIDSGHGWLNGPDISDMALFDARCGKGTRVFGKNIPAEDTQKQATRRQLFESAQARTLQECTELLRIYNRFFGPGDLAFLNSVAIRSLESFKSVLGQPDFDAAAHVGGAIPTVNAAANITQHPNGGQPPVGQPHQPPQVVVSAGLYQAGAANPLQQPAVGQPYNNPPINYNQPQHNITLFHPATFNNGLFPAPPTQSSPGVTNLAHQGRSDHRQNARGRDRNPAGVVKLSKKEKTLQPQLPIIFNGFNLSAEIGGWCHIIKKKIAPPKSFPLQPGTLTEAQAQWLMETVWAQRAFLSAYTTSVLANRACFAQVNALHIAKISSGLLSSLEQKELWQGLPGLTNLTVLVSPDWRVEHITGDQNFNSNMLISPVEASMRLTDFLKAYIAPIEKLSHLTVGFVGGGEHATGIMARNRHVLPAPISSAPRIWLSNHVTEPDPRTIVTFNHIKHLTVQNAWFSPLMLEAFMIKSQDTSLRTLALESVSLTAAHGQRLVAPLTTATEPLNPVHPPSMWLHESLPTTHCWPATIDRITPGATFLDQKYDAGMIADPYTNPRPPPSFRGFVSRLIFKSCGYVRVSGISIQELNQNDLVYPNSDPMDAGLKDRAAALAEKGVMLSDKNPNTGADWPLLGKLTQCVHPVEKRVLEQAWGMSFGWGDTLERWAAVEDGCFEGGTGRFSGVIVGEGGKGIDGLGE